MAGKTRKKGGQHSPSGGRPVTPANSATPRGLMDSPLKGHLGLKSSPFAPTDCKLMSQYMVLDHMSAHYKKVNTAKSRVDTSTPKAWLVSQKVRDRARRECLKQDLRRRDDWLRHSTHRGSVAASDHTRDEMIAMMESINMMDEAHGGYDDVDGRRLHAGQHEDHTTVQANPSSTSGEVIPQRLHNKDMPFVDRMVEDQENAPSHYHSSKRIKSNIPSHDTSRAHSRTSPLRQSAPTAPHLGAQRTILADGRHMNGSMDMPVVQNSPRGNDLLDKRAHLFTEEKPFQPRTLRVTGATSKLSEFKYYNPPKKRTSPRPEEQETHVTREKSQTVHQQPKGHGQRPQTPMTESVDWMNETLMSRDSHAYRRSPTGVPPLDISLDTDNFNWLKEQSEKAQLRASYSTLQSDRPVSREARPDGIQGHDPTPPPGTAGKGYTLTAEGTMTREEELKYLEFVTDVTNDVLDRGIFTNRVLKQVFEAHVEKRKHQLKVSKMRELLDELRHDLGIPLHDDADSDNLGHSSTRPWSPEDSQMSYAAPPTEGSPHHKEGQRAGRQRGHGPSPSSPQKALPSLHARPTPKRGSSDGRPPLPRHGRGSRPGSACSFANTEILEEEGEEDVHQAGSMMGATMKYGTHIPTGEELISGGADILKIDHEDEQGVDELDMGTLSPQPGHNTSLEDNAFQYEEHITQSKQSEQHTKYPGFHENTAPSETSEPFSVEDAKQKEDRHTLTPVSGNLAMSEASEPFSIEDHRDENNDTVRYEDEENTAEGSQVGDDDVRDGYELTMKYQDALRDNTHPDTNTADGTLLDTAHSDTNAAADDYDYGEEGFEEESDVPASSRGSPVARPRGKHLPSTPHSDIKETPRSGEHTSETIEISELDESELGDDF